MFALAWEIHTDSKEEDAPGCRAKCRISSTVSISLSGGACRTIMREPSKHNEQPTRPRCPSCSFKKNEARIALQ